MSQQIADTSRWKVFKFDHSKDNGEMYNICQEYKLSL